MAEYIERETAIMTAMNYDGNGTAQDASQDVAAALGCIPAADVRPVVRGRWVDGKCDNCGEHAPYWCLATTFHESNYCPNCGAKMEAQDDN